MPSEAGQAAHSRRWLDYFSHANPLLGPQKNQAISANAESFGPYYLIDFFNKVVFDNMTSRISLTFAGPVNLKYR
jgi:hypothetical protein